MRNYRQELELALSGGAPDHIPFSFYDLLFPPGFNPAPLQAKGMAICARRFVYRKVTPNVREETFREANGAVRTVLTTPAGTLTRVDRPAAVGMAPITHPIRRLEDYRVAEFIARDTHYEPAYEEFRAEQAKLGDRGVVIAHTGYSPLLEIQILWIGQEQFCY